MNKKVLILITILLVLALGLFTLTGCTDKKEDSVEVNELAVNTEDAEKVADTNIEKEESDIDVDSLSDEEKIEHVLFSLLKQTYGDDLDSAKIMVDKMYTAKEAEKEDMLKDYKLGENDIAFEATIYFLPAEGADPNQFTIPNGEYDEESGWVQEASRLGILRVNENKEPKYEITDFGTGW